MTNTLSAHHKQYLDHLKKQKKSNSTILAYGKDVEQFVTYSEHNGNISPEQISSELIDAFTNDLKQKRYTTKSIVRKINSLKSFFSYLQDLEVLVKNPVDAVERPRYTNQVPRVLTRMEYRALRDACRDDVRVSSIVELLLQTGLRISELANLQLNDLHLDKKEMVVQVSESGDSRVVPLNPSAVKAIQEYLEVRPKAKSSLLFLTKNCKPFLVRNIRSAIDRYFKLAGVKNAKVNDLRHTFIVQQLSAGLPLVYVSKVVGHKRLNTTEKYLQFLDDTFDSSKIKIEEL